MKLVIFGATGRTGRLVVGSALSEGHFVTAFVRDLSKLGISDTHLVCVRGDIADAKSVQTAIAGQQAVLSALGPTREGPKDILSTGAANIIAGMTKYGVRRLIWQTGAGIADPEDASSPTRAFMAGLMRLVAPNALHDSEQAFRLIKASCLDWTIVRVPRLGAGPARGDVHVSNVPPGPRPVSRGDVAAFMIRQLFESTYIQRAPMFGYP